MEAVLDLPKTKPQTVIFYRLENEDYKQVSESGCLPGVKSGIVTELLFAAEEMKRSEWLQLVHRLIEKS